MTKNSKKYIIAITIFLVLYNVLVWCIPFPKNDLPTFIISYVASIIAFLAQLIIYYIAIHNKDSLKSKLYGWPILKVGYVYGVIQLCITIIFYIIGSFIEIPTWISIVVCVILIGLALIGVLVTDTYREEIEKMEINAPITKKFVLDLRIDSEAFAKKITTEPIHSELVAFAELVKYSDPVSTDALVDFEDEISRKYIEIKELVINERLIEARNELKEITILMEERNKRCKATKK